MGERNDKRPPTPFRLLTLVTGIRVLEGKDLSGGARAGGWEFASPGSLFQGKTTAT